jgi:hypothetical protein
MIWRLGLAVAIVLAAIAIRLALLSALDTRLVYVTLYPAVAIAAIVGGLPAGLLATLLSAVLAHVLFAPLDHAAAIIGLTAFLISCSIVVGMAEVMRVFQQKLASTMQIRQSSSSNALSSGCRRQSRCSTATCAISRPPPAGATISASTTM